MRKTIFIFLIIIISFIFIDNVYALNTIEDRFDIVSEIEIFNINDLSDDEMKNIPTTRYNNGWVSSNLYDDYNYLLGVFNKQNTYDSYIISTSYYDDTLTLLMYNKNEASTTYNLSIGLTNGNPSNTHLYFGLFTTNNFNYKHYRRYNSSYDSITLYTTNNNTNFNSEFTNYKYVYFTYKNTNKLNLYFDANNIDNFIYSVDNPLCPNGVGGTSYSYGNSIYYNDELLFSNGNATYDKTPTINFENIQNSYNDKNEIISISVDINLKNINNSKHLVQYTTQSSIDYNYANGGIEHWLDISPDTLKTFTTNINDTLYVRIIDAEKYWESADKGEELVIDLIDSATFTFTNIVETLPTIQYSTNIPDICKITHNNIDYISCVELNMNVKNMNVNKYKLYHMYYYSDTDTYTEWVQHYNYQSKEYINENMTIFYKITDKEDNYITSSSVSIVGIKEFLDLGLFIEFSDKYLKNSRLVEITMKIANDNNYTYYYSTNNGLEYKVVQDITDINFNIKKGIFYTDTNGKILVKVVDSNGQVVNIFEHTINYKQLQMNNDSFGGYINSIFNFFITPITHIFSLITTFYTTLPTILQYLFSGIFILAIFYYIIKFIL